MSVWAKILLPLRRDVMGCCQVRRSVNLLHAELREELVDAAPGVLYPDALAVVNDHGNHYSWEPRVEMPSTDYVVLLAAMNPHFIKVS
jgi:hypothetical protein